MPRYEGKLVQLRSTLLNLLKPCYVIISHCDFVEFAKLAEWLKRYLLWLVLKL